MQELLDLLVELQELCKRRRGLDVPGQWLGLAQGAGLGACLAPTVPLPSHQLMGPVCKEP